MSVSLSNKLWFALEGPPPEQIQLGRRQFRIQRVFKHDFFAATCLYQAEDVLDGDTAEKIVVKFGRQSRLFGLSMKWAGALMRRREEKIYSRLDGIAGVPRWLGRIGPTGYAIQFIDAVPLDHIQSIPAGFFDRLMDLMKAIHSRGVGYCDANKRSNILVGQAGEPFLVDFQISLLRRDNWPWPWNRIIRAIVDYMVQRDIYHLLKHKRRLAPSELTGQEDAQSRKRDLLHKIHRRLAKIWRHLRRGFLQKRFETGRMRSPTAHLEDHIQPEKATWRKVHGSPGDEGGEGNEGDGPGPNCPD